MLKYMYSFILLVAVTVVGVTSLSPDACNPSPCDLDVTIVPDNVINMEGDASLPLTIQTNLTNADNLTVSITSDDTDLVQEPEITRDITTGAALIHITIKGGKKYDQANINISLQWWNDGILTVAVVQKEVTIIRPEAKTSTQNMVEYIVMAMALTVCFLAGCETTFTDVKKWVAHIGCGLLVQCVLFPVVSRLNTHTN